MSSENNDGLLFNILLSVKNHFIFFLTTILLLSAIVPAYSFFIRGTRFQATVLVSIGYLNIDSEKRAELKELPIEKVNDVVFKLQSFFQINSKENAKFPRIKKIEKVKGTDSLIKIITEGKDESSTLSRAQNAADHLIKEHELWLKETRSALLKNMEAIDSGKTKNLKKDIDQVLDYQNHVQILKRNLSIFGIRPTRTVGKIDLRASAFDRKILIVSFLMFIFSIMVALTGSIGLEYIDQKNKK